ncbi:MAG TPA: ABC transporter substrate-binding protein [Acidimicrobiales bacterium]|nr:ABC transporter substrate-binding protein [Acidimicrobiales bacterium]
MPKRLSLVAVVMLFAAACTAAPRGHSDALTLGAIYPISGLQGPGGAEEANGVKLAVELANERGGVQGRPLRLELLDVDRGDAAPRAIGQLQRRGVDVVLGTYGSTISAPAAAAAQRSGMVLWETGAVGLVGSDAGAGDTFFRLAPMGAGLGRAAVAFVRDQLSGSLGTAAPLRYAVAYVDDAYGRSVGLGAAEEAKASGQELVGTFPYSVRGLDADALVRDIALTRPDVLFVSAYLEDGIALRKAQVSQGLGLKASIGTSSSYCMPSFAHALGPAAVGLFASDKPDGREVRLDALQPEAQKVLSWGRDRYRQLHGEEMTPAALSGFANAWALVGHVLPASAGVGARAVADAARSVKLAGGTLPNGAGLDLAGPGVDDAGENRRAVSVIWQWVDASTQAVVWPPAFATRPLQAIPIQ